MVYYLWLIRPFWQRLEKLALHRTEEPSPYIWAKDQGTWDSKRLGDVLDREFRARLGTPANISMYRHAAIAISRKYLDCGGFKRDYDVDEKRTDLQAAHSSWTASSIYARGIEEAAGHVQIRRAEFRKVSRQWHEFLGFSSFNAVRKRPNLNVIHLIRNAHPGRPVAPFLPPPIGRGGPDPGKAGPVASRQTS